MQPSLIAQCCQLILDKIGLHFPQENWKELEKKLGALSHTLHFPNLQSCMEWILTPPFDQEKLDLLAQHLTVGETYFFRDEATFQLLKDQILPSLIQTRQQTHRLRIWSIGCCTGEEPYSIAILLSQLLPPSSPWSIEIVGIDINKEFLERATRAHYKAWAFRNTSPAMKEKYFTQKQANSWGLIPQIQKMVHFRYLNLIDGQELAALTHKPAADLILCNNVLIYFSLPHIQKVVQHLSNALVEDGILIVTPIEAPYITDPRLTSMRERGSSFFRKITSPSTPVPIQSHPLSPPSPFSKPKTARSPSLSPPSSTPSSAEILISYEQGRYEEVLSRLEKKIAQGALSNDQEIHLLIKSYVHQRKLKQADQWCDKALSQNKLDPLLYYLKAQVLQELNCLAEAVDYLKRALFLEPNLVVAHFALGNLLLIQGDAQNAHRHFRNVLTLLHNSQPDGSLPGEEEDLTTGRLLNLVQGLLAKESPL
jgi:chemotaxis protein methyltransferase CheR